MPSGGETMSDNPGYNPERDRALAGLENQRLADMDTHGISQQIVSATMPGADRLDGDDSPARPEEVLTFSGSLSTDFVS
jgi:hypothetical protein